MPLLLSGNSRPYTELENNQVLLGITTDSNLTFENHINSICKKATQRLKVH